MSVRSGTSICLLIWWYFCRGQTVSSTTTNLYKRKRKESLAFTYFSSRLHLSLDKTLQRHTYPFHMYYNVFFSCMYFWCEKCKILRKAWKKKLSFHFSWCLKEVYISHCTVQVGALYTDLHIWWMIGCNKLAILRVIYLCLFVLQAFATVTNHNTKIIPCNENRLESNQPDLFFKINARRPFSKGPCLDMHQPNNNTYESMNYVRTYCIITRISVDMNV